MRSMRRLAAAACGACTCRLPRRNEVLAIDADSHAIIARASAVMEGGDLDLVPAAQLQAPPDT